MIFVLIKFEHLAHPKMPGRWLVCSHTTFILFSTTPSKWFFYLFVKIAFLLHSIGILRQPLSFPYQKLCKDICKIWMSIWIEMWQLYFERYNCINMKALPLSCCSAEMRLEGFPWLNNTLTAARRIRPVPLLILLPPHILLSAAMRITQECCLLFILSYLQPLNAAPPHQVRVEGTYEATFSFYMYSPGLGPCPPWGVES